MMNAAKAKTAGFIAMMVMMVVGTGAEDRKERQWFTPALPPKHQAKPKVEGWAASRTRVEETLTRGLVAVATPEGKVHLSWRMLKGDPADMAFDVYRVVEGVEIKLNAEPIKKTTDLIDEQPAWGRKCEYVVRSAAGGKMAESAKAVLAENAKSTTHCLSIKLDGEYGVQRVGAGDLNGDGVYDFVIKQPGSSVDPGNRNPRPDVTYKLEAYACDPGLKGGKFLWRKDLGRGIEPGIWYSPYVVYDLDGDGKAEVAAKTGPEDDPRDANGLVEKGPEYVSVLDGMTGKEMARADWPPRDARYGDYNRNNRQQMGVAYLDGKTPCLLVARGTYKLMVVDAYQYQGKKLERLWHWEGDDETPVIRSQGSHQMHAADVDGDGRDEVVLGSCVLDDDGTCLWSAGLGHPDKTYVSDIDPARPGLEIFYAVEPDRDDGMGVCLLDAATGKTLWKLGRPTRHVGDAMAADIDPTIPGLECWATEDPKGGSRDKYMFSAAGKPLGTAEDVPGCRSWVFWDGDLLRETITGGGFAGFGRGFGRDFGRGVARGTGRDAGRRGGEGFGRFQRLPSVVAKYKGETVGKGIEGQVLLIADLLGDWREEIVTVTAGELRVYTTAIPARDRRPCLMQDPIYRSDVTQRSQGYEQAPVTGYYLGVDPAEAGKADAVIVKKGGVVGGREGFQE